MVIAMFLGKPFLNVISPGWERTEQLVDIKAITWVFGSATSGAASSGQLDVVDLSRQREKLNCRSWWIKVTPDEGPADHYLPRYFPGMLSWRIGVSKLQEEGDRVAWEQHLFAVRVYHALHGHTFVPTREVCWL